MRAQVSVWTIGHWTCPEETFVRLLGGERIELVADVRSQPGSRANPQFDQNAMRSWLDRAGIGYVHLPELGGRRPKQDVAPRVNAGWHQPSFKNYADYSLTPDYERGIQQLTDLATTRRVAYLCAEPMPWRCHRLLISNTLTARGLTVRHIMGGRNSQLHELGKWGATPRVHPDGTITYPPDA
jgi:uncharacterized protein (DUF488 family)